jgi:hypothetical protein
MEVVNILGIGTGYRDAGNSIEARAVGHGTAEGVVRGVLEPMPQTLPERSLQRIVIHHRVGVGIADGAVVAYTRGCIVRSRGLCKTGGRRM